MGFSQGGVMAYDLALGSPELDVLGIRMQSAMAHAVAEIGRTSGTDAVSLVISESTGNITIFARGAALLELHFDRVARQVRRLDLEAERLVAAGETGGQPDEAQLHDVVEAITAAADRLEYGAEARIQRVVRIKLGRGAERGGRAGRG